MYFGGGGFFFLWVFLGFLFLGFFWLVGWFISFLAGEVCGFFNRKKSVADKHIKRERKRKRQNKTRKRLKYSRIQVYTR